MFVLPLAALNEVEGLANLVLLAYTHPCANRWPAEVAEHVSCTEEKRDNVAPADPSKIVVNNTAKYNAYGLCMEKYYYINIWHP